MAAIDAHLRETAFGATSKADLCQAAFLAVKPAHLDKQGFKAWFNVFFDKDKVRLVDDVHKTIPQRLNPSHTRTHTHTHTVIIIIPKAQDSARETARGPPLGAKDRRGSDLTEA